MEDKLVVFDNRYQRSIIKITVDKITDIDDLHLANWTTSGKVSRQSLRNCYKTGHSTMRTQKFRIICEGIPQFVYGHLVRHTAGVDPYCQSRREDISGLSDPDRYIPSNYTFYCNAESLINMSYWRLCNIHPSPETVDVFKMIKEEVRKVDPDLALFMVPSCVSRNGLCQSNKSCGLWKNVQTEYKEYYDQFKFRSKHLTKEAVDKMIN